MVAPKRTAPERSERIPFTAARANGHGQTAMSQIIMGWTSVEPGRRHARRPKNENGTFAQTDGQIVLMARLSFKMKQKAATRLLPNALSRST
jgi:hypothetical protein